MVLHVLSGYFFRHRMVELKIRDFCFLKHCLVFQGSTPNSLLLPQCPQPALAALAWPRLTMHASICIIIHYVLAIHKQAVHQTDRQTDRQYFYFYHLLLLKRSPTKTSFLIHYQIKQNIGKFLQFLPM